jgi:hypothetical protein
MDRLPPYVLANARQIHAGLTVKNGEPYSPSDATEGELFMTIWCEKCIREKYEACTILQDGILCGEQPEEWQYHDNCPICTAFEPA